MTDVRSRLLSLGEEDYAAFMARLIPTVPAGTILGVRTPALRKLARELWRDEAAAPFLDALPHAYFEENLLHGFLLEQERDCARCLSLVERFLPWVDNWAVCDEMNPPAFRRCRPELLERIRVWTASPRPYVCRFGIKMLMTHFLDADFQPETLHLVSVIRSEEYYVNMMRAWYYATALAKQYDAALPVLEERRLDRWTHNRAIQKALESRHLSEDRKQYLKSLRWKAEKD